MKMHKSIIFKIFTPVSNAGNRAIVNHNLSCFKVGILGKNCMHTSYASSAYAKIIMSQQV